MKFDITNISSRVDNHHDSRVGAFLCESSVSRQLYVVCYWAYVLTWGKFLLFGLAFIALSQAQRTDTDSSSNDYLLPTIHIQY